MPSTFRTITTKAGDTLQVSGRFSSADIPSDWTKQAVLERNTDLSHDGVGERFAFFSTPDGQVAQVFFHPMNGAQDMFARIGTRDFMAAAYRELMEGERFESRSYLGAGRYDVRKGRMRKARRIA